MWFLDFLEAVLKQITWPIALLIIFLLLFKEIKNILRRIAKGQLPVRYGNWEIGGLSPEQIRDLSVKKGEFEKQGNEHLIELVRILRKYAYVWANWEKTGDPRYCHEVRFSDAYYGPVLRYIDDFSDYLNLYIRCYGKELSSTENLFKSVQNLKAYLDKVKTYHEKGQVLKEPKFSMPEYESLILIVVANLKSVSATIESR